MSGSTASRIRKSVSSAACCLLAAGLVFPAQARAETPDPTPTPDAADADVRWSVKPADESGPDGRKTMELSLSPGERVTEHVAVKNIGKAEATFGLSAADGYRNRNGRFDMLTADQESVAAGTWIEIADDVTVGPGESRVVPFEIAVPETATPGDYLAGVAAGLAMRGASGMSVTNRMGFRISITVSGERMPGAELEVTGVAYHPSANPFSPGRAEVSYTVANTGNVRLSAQGEARVTGPFGALARSTTLEIAELEPGARREGKVSVEGVWPTFLVTGAISLSARDLGEPDAAPLAQLESAKGAAAPPFAQLILLALAIGLALVARLALRWRRSRVDALIERAVAERVGGSPTAPDTEPPTSPQRAKPEE